MKLTVVSRRWIGSLAALALAAAVGALIVVVLTDRIPARDDQPPGCTARDRDQPGCRVTRQRITSSTVALTSVVVTPLATLVVALVAVGAGRRRQEEQLGAEQDRLQSRHEHELNLKRLELDHDRRSRDREALRQFLDQISTLVEEAYDSINERVVALRFPRESPDDADGYKKWAQEFVELAADTVRKLGLGQVASRQLDLRLPFGHPINKAARQMVELLAAANRPVPAFPPMSDAQDDECSEKLTGVMRTYRIFTQVVQQRLAVDVGDETSMPEVDIDAMLATAAEGHA
jgi:hypothetical protein